jgi:RNA recognition motif-containing protein
MANANINYVDPNSESSGSGISMSNHHLSYPAPSTRPPTPTPEPRQLLKDRLYVGNLHPTVDECVRPDFLPVSCILSRTDTYVVSSSTRYTLLQIFSKFGKVTKLDFLFHKTGLMKGKPRGYAFIEYGNQDVCPFRPSLNLISLTVPVNRMPSRPSRLPTTSSFGAASLS